MAPSSLQDYLESKDPPAKKVKHANKTHSSRASSLRAKETVSRSKPPENGSPPLVGVDDLRVPSTHQDVPKDLYHGPTTSHTAVHRSHSKSPQQWEVGLDFDTGLRQTGSIHSPLGSHGNGDGRHPDQLRSLNLEPLPYVYGDAWVQDAVGAILNGQNHESNGREYLGNTPMVQEDLDETQLIAEMLRTNMSLQPSSNELDLPSSVWDGRDIFSDRLLDELFESFREPVVAEPSLDIDVEWDLFEQTTNGLQADDSLSNENQHVEDDEIVAPSSQHPNMEEHNSMPDFTHNTHQPASSQSPPPTETPEPAFSTCPDSNVKRGLDPWHAIPADQNRLSTASTLVGSNPVDNAIEMNLDVESEDENDFSRPLHNVQALVNGNALKGHGPYANFAAPTWTTANGADPRAMKRKPVIVTEASRKRRRRRLSDEARSQNTKDIPTSNDPTHVASDVLEDAGVQLMGAIEQVPFNADDTPIRAHPTTSVADVPMIKIEHSEGLEETPDVVPQKQSQEAMQTLKADEDDGSGKPMDQTTVHCAEASEAEVIQVTKPLNNQNSPQQILPETHNVCSQESTQIDKTAEEAAKALEKAKAMDQVKTWERNKREKARELRRQQIQAQEKAIAVTKKKNAKKQAREQNLARVREKWAKEKRAQRERDREQQILDSHAPQKHLTEEQNEMCGNQHTTVAAPLHRPADITTSHSAAESSEPTTTRRKFRLKFGGKEIVNGLF